MISPEAGHEDRSEVELSVVVPARDAAATLGRCLDALAREAGDRVEVIVVDDGSSDGTADIARRSAGVRLVSPGGARGPAAARNFGVAAARASLILFVDADVVIGEGALARVLRHFADPSVDAVFGSYDDDPEAPSTVSRFKNLAHHHFHQRSSTEASTFWAGCGAIRKDRFAAIGGFDSARYDTPSIEDVELGSRLRAAGARVVLDREVQVKHLKRWTLATLVSTDVLSRAIPWTVLALERTELPRDLNFDWPQRIAAALAPGLLAVSVATAWRPSLAPLLAVLLGAAFWLNRDLFALFRRRGGARLVIAGFVLQQLYYLYSIVGLGAGFVVYRMGRRAPRSQHGEAAA